MQVSPRQLIGIATFAVGALAVSFGDGLARGDRLRLPAERGAIRAAERSVHPPKANAASEVTAPATPLKIASSRGGNSEHARRLRPRTSPPFTADSIVMILRPAESVGLTTAVPVESAYTIINGPRTDTNVTKIWINQFGAPTKVIDAASNVTQLTYSSTWPLLVQEVTSPSGFVQHDSLDAAGLRVMSVGFDGLADGKNDTTLYEWDTKWRKVTKITSPMGVVQQFAYDTGTGNLKWQQPGTDSARRVRFVYDANGQVAKVIDAEGNRDSLVYDALGNVVASITPLGYRTDTYRDAIGRDTLRVVPTDTISADSLKMKVRTRYDAIGRVDTAITIGKTPGAGNADTLRIFSQYDAEGHLLSVTRSAFPLTPGVGALTTYWSYDSAGRQVSESPPGCCSEIRDYDKAGNVTRITTRAGYEINMKYDALNRLQTRVVDARDYGPNWSTLAARNLEPWYARFEPFFPNGADSGYHVARDSQWFVYDATGMIEAGNADAVVRRTYYPNGHLAMDSTLLPTWPRDSVHAYGIGHQYDRDGRLTVTHMPLQLAPPSTGNGESDSARYNYPLYPPTMGQLFQVIDVGGQSFSFEYDNRGNLQRQWSAYSYRDSSHYDADGRLDHNWVLHSPDSAWRDESLKLDALGRAVRDTNTAGRRGGLRAQYSGLGHLRTRTVNQPAVTQFLDGASLSASEAYLLDGMGNRIFRGDSNSASGRLQYMNGNSYDSSAYDPFGRLAKVFHALYADTLQYDEGGNLVYQGPRSTEEPVEFPVLTDRTMFYGADDRLRATATFTLMPDYDQYYYDHYYRWSVTFDEYRYDALGRRVSVRTQRDCYNENWTIREICQMDEYRRTVWDGASELVEIRMPAGSQAENDQATVTNQIYSYPFVGADYNPLFGRVAYTYGIDPEHPLSATRISFSIDTVVGSPAQMKTYAPISVVPHWDWRGNADRGTINGVDTLCVSAANTTKRCPKVQWKHQSHPYETSRSVETDAWFGSILEDREDPSGMLYRRNRYLDGATGRFTQEDPIGLAGGMNLYGFAGGDPVNFSDPLGLNCVDKNGKEVPCPPGQDAALRQDEKGIERITPTPAEGAAVLAVALIPAGKLIEGGLSAVGAAAAEPLIALQLKMSRNPIASYVGGFAAGVAFEKALSGGTVEGGPVVAGLSTFQKGFGHGREAAAIAEAAWNMVKMIKGYD